MSIYTSMTRACINERLQGIMFLRRVCVRSMQRLSASCCWRGLQNQDYHSKHPYTNNCICTILVDFETFQRVLNRPGGFRDPGEPDEYCRGFQVFDKDMTGFIGVGQLKYILTNLGEKMTDEEVDELLKAVDTSSGQVNYTELVRTILAN